MLNFPQQNININPKQISQQITRQPNPLIRIMIFISHSFIWIISCHIKLLNKFTKRPSFLFSIFLIKSNMWQKIRIHPLLHTIQHLFIRPLQTTLLSNPHQCIINIPNISILIQIHNQTIRLLPDQLHNLGITRNS